MFRIVDWEKHYETAETRKIKHLSWVPVKTKHDGLGYRKLMAIDPSGSYLAAFILMVQMAAKMEVRGDIPLCPDEMGIKTGMSGDVFEAAIPHLISIGWVEELGDSILERPDNLLVDQDNLRNEQNRTVLKDLKTYGTSVPNVPSVDPEPKKRTHAPKKGAVIAQMFDLAWKAYPKRLNNPRQAALKAWNARVAEHITEQTLMDATLGYVKYCKVHKVTGEYVKQAKTFFGPGEHWREFVGWEPAREPERNMPNPADVAKRAAEQAAVEADMLDAPVEVECEDCGKVYETRRKSGKRVCAECAMAKVKGA